MNNEKSKTFSFKYKDTKFSISSNLVEEFHLLDTKD